jgi:hypothetical protein
MNEKKEYKNESNLLRIKKKYSNSLGKYSKDVLLIYACYIINKTSK